jgi:hypothetical protein
MIVVKNLFGIVKKDVTIFKIKVMIIIELILIITILMGNIMKSIVKHTIKRTIKNNKRHCLHFNYFQENHWHNKEEFNSFQDKAHNYNKVPYACYYFNGKYYYEVNRY